MKFTRYADLDSFADDTLELLLEDEVQNNLPIGFIGNKTADSSQWLLASVKGADGGVLLVAACTPPFNLVLYEAGNRPRDPAVQLLADEMKGLGFAPPGVLAARGLSQRFSQAYAGNKEFQLNLSMHAMRLDAVRDIAKAPGRLRPLREDDLYYAPHWARAFAEDCRVEVYDLDTYARRLASRLGANTHYIWEDGHPVSQAVHGRSTKNGAVVNGVYTPPHERGKGYASSAVAELSRLLLDRGHQFCCLFADAANPISCGLYRKIGYRNLCVMDEIKFVRPVAAL